MLGKPIPSHIYDTIDAHIAKKQWDYAWSAIADAINAYQDKKIAPYNCLWLYHKAAYVASQVNYSMAVANANKFIIMSEELLNLGSHMQNLELQTAQIRPPRRDEIDEMRALMQRTEIEYIEKQTSKGKPQEQIQKEIDGFRGEVINKTATGGCFTLALTALAGIAGIAVGIRLLS